MTEKEFMMLGFSVCDDLLTYTDIDGQYPETTPEEKQAIATTRNIFARKLALSIHRTVIADEFFDGNTQENIHRYFEKATETDLIPLKTWSREDSLSRQCPDQEAERTETFCQRMHRLLKQFSLKKQ